MVIKWEAMYVDWFMRVVCMCCGDNIAEEFKTFSYLYFIFYTFYAFVHVKHE